MRGDNQKLIQLLGVVLEHVLQVLDGGCERHVGSQPQVDDTSVRLAMAKDELTEVKIVGDENVPLLLGEAEHLDVREAGRMIPATRIAS